MHARSDILFSRPSSCEASSKAKYSVQTTPEAEAQCLQFFPGVCAEAIAEEVQYKGGPELRLS